MVGVVNMFDIGKSGMMTSKGSLSTTSHNIANVNTEGFSRQQVEQAANPTISTGKLTFGTGVHMKSVSRINDDFLGHRIQVENRNNKNSEEKDIYLSQTEQIFNESNSEGLNKLATRFFNEFRKLSSDPSNESIRSTVRETSKQLASDINRMDRQLKEMQRNIDEKMVGYVDEFNALTKEIRDLNLLIEKGELMDSKVPDLQDSRDLALKRLGAMADISTSRDKNGKVTVTLAGHVPVVNGGDFTKIEIMHSPADPANGKSIGLIDIVVKEPVPQSLNHFLKTGRFGGLLDVRDNDVGAALKQVNDIALEMTESVNAIHAQGYGKDGGTGRLFFRDLTGLKDRAAEFIGLSEDVKNNVNAIAAGGEPDSPSDNRVAIAISGLGTMKHPDTQSSIIDDYNSMVGELGVKNCRE